MVLLLYLAGVNIGSSIIFYKMKKQIKDSSEVAVLLNIKTDKNNNKNFKKKNLIQGKPILR